MKKFIVMEGLDGAGKSTQIELLKNYLDEKKIQYRYLHFPQTDSPRPLIFGEMVANFLKGEFGDIDTVNPYLVALLYAGDRNDAKETLNNWLDEDAFLVVDRYVYSNMAFQGAKFNSLEEKHKLRKWIEKLEYEYNKIPRPTLSIFLRMSFDFVSQKLKDTRNGESRKYLEGKKDIHENNLEFQKKVETEYMNMVAEKKDIFSIDCFDKTGKTLTPEEIHEKIISLLVEKSIL
jgi:dTMP kinase